VDGEEAKDVLLKQLIADHDAPYAAQWRGLPESYTQGMLKAIVAFKGEVLDVKCKIKLNQHRSEAHDRMKADYAQGSEQERALAQWMVKLGL
jgi:transcriptional regulator